MACPNRPEGNVVGHDHADGRLDLVGGAPERRRVGDGRGHLQPEAARYYEAGKRSIDRSARQLPPFLAAHAALLEVVPKAPERTLDTCAALVLHLFATVDALPESSASVVRQGAIGVQQLLLALQTRGDALERFLQRWVYNAAIVTVDAAAQARMIASD